jgi:hypothetical protein
MGWGIGVGIGWPNSSTINYDSSTIAFIGRVKLAGGSLSILEKNAVNQLVVDLKAYGLWDSMKAIYPMVGASAAACAQNLKSSSFTGTFTSGWTFASTGVTPNGTSAYMDSGINPNTQLTLNNTHLSIYSRTQDTTKSGLDFSAVSAGPTRHFGLTAYYAALSTGLSIQYLYPTNSATGYASSTQGLFTSSRISSTDNKLYRNTTTLGTDTFLNTSTLPITNLLLGANTGGEYQNRQYAFASCGDGLTDTQASNLYTAVQAFQITLSRQV